MADKSFVMIQILIVGLGGFLGSIARYGISGLLLKPVAGGFPWGTLAVNVTGCLAIGGVVYLAEDRAMLSQNVRLFLAVGILGGFTTFSAFGNETIELMRGQATGLALLNVAANLLLGLLAVWLGRAILKAAGA